MLPSILAFNLYLIWGNLLAFWGLGEFKNLLGSAYTAQQLLNYYVAFHSEFDFDLILWLFLAFWDSNGLFMGLG